MTLSMGMKLVLSRPRARIMPKRIAKKIDVASEKLNETKDSGSK